MLTIIAAGGLVFNENNELLMIFRRGKWDLPKGKLDKGEAIEECAVREVEEETGVTPIDLNNLIDITTHEYYDKWENATVLKKTYWYKMYTTSNKELIPQAEEEIQKAEWVAIQHIPEKLTNTYPNIIKVVGKVMAL